MPEIDQERQDEGARMLAAVAAGIDGEALDLETLVRAGAAFREIPDAANHPDRKVFDHFFAMEVTWR
jgi:hypothetical protein